MPLSSLRSGRFDSRLASIRAINHLTRPRWEEYASAYEASPSEEIHALVSGYSRVDRESKILVMLQTYVDDSASEQDDKILLLAGYVQEAKTWSAFSDDWRKVLESIPSIKYFHMVEAENLRDEFRGWTPTNRDLKIDALADIIVKYQPWSIECSVSRANYQRIIEPVAPYNLRYPYFPCFYGIVLHLAQWHAARKQNDPSLDMPPVDFIFDEQGAIGVESVLWYQFIKSIQTPIIQSYLGGTPVFKDDKKILPLQAADLLAWHLRRRKEKRNQNEVRPIMEKLIPLRHAEVNIGRELLNQMAQEMSQVPNVEMTRGKKNSVRQALKQLFTGK
jgi:hypothetical protein